MDNVYEILYARNVFSVMTVQQNGKSKKGGLGKIILTKKKIVPPLISPERASAYIIQKTEDYLTPAIISKWTDASPLTATCIFVD